MFMGDIRKYPGPKLYVPQSGGFGRQAVGGRFYHCIPQPRLHHFVEKGMNFRGFRGGLAEMIVYRTVSGVELYGREKTGGAAEGGEHLIDEIDGTAFPVGAGYADGMKGP